MEETHTCSEELRLCGRVEAEVPQYEHRALLVVLRATGAKLQEQTHSICNIHQSVCHEVKVCHESESMFYTAHYLIFMTAQGTSHITPWQTCSDKHHHNTSGKISAILQLVHKKYLNLYIHHSLLSSFYDCSRCFTHYSLADLFNQTSSQHFWEDLSHPAISAQRLLISKYPPLSIARYSFVQFWNKTE